MKHVNVWLLCFALLSLTFSADALAIEHTNHAGPAKTAHLRKILEPLGSGQDAIVAVRLRDKSVVSGFVAEVGQQSFVIADPESQIEHAIAYSQVVRLQGYNLATGAEVHDGIGFRSKLVRLIKYVVPMPQTRSNSLTGGQKTLLLGIVIGIVIAIVLAKAL